jgi:hypothetical protein
MRPTFETEYGLHMAHSTLSLSLFWRSILGPTDNQIFYPYRTTYIPYVPHTGIKYATDMEKTYGIASSCLLGFGPAHFTSTNEKPGPARNPLHFYNYIAYSDK